MPQYDRSGSQIGCAYVGWWSTIRQEVLLPGESLKPRLSGFVHVNPLRERLVMPLHCSIVVAAAPIRWYDSGLIPQVTGGPSVSTKFTSMANLASAGISSWDHLGLGDIDYAGVEQPPQFFLSHAHNVYNWWFKWPTDPGVPFTAATASLAERGWASVNLESNSTRLHSLPISGDPTFTHPDGQFDVRLLDTFRAAWRDMQDREWRANDRYDEVLKDLYGAHGTNEAEKIPFILGEYKDWLPADQVFGTDGPNLGASIGVMEASIDWSLPYTYRAPEHMVLSYHVVFRAPPIFASSHTPWRTHASWDWGERIGDPKMIAHTQPKRRSFSHFNNGSPTSYVGIEPSGQMYRNGWQSTHRRVSERPFMISRQAPATATGFHYHQSYDTAFQSNSMRNLLFRIDIQQQVRNAVPDPYSSIASGAD